MRAPRTRLAGVIAVLLVIAIACGEAEPSAEVVGEGTDPASVEGPDLGDHWHVAYGISICGQDVPPLADSGPDVRGIHTHSDGLIHIHPFEASVSGANATLGTFLSQVDVEVAESSIDVHAYGEAACEGDAEVRLAYWESAHDAGTGADPDRIVAGDEVTATHLGGDGGAFALVLGDPDDPIAAPESVFGLCQGAGVDGGAAEPGSYCADIGDPPAPTGQSVDGEDCVEAEPSDTPGAPEVPVREGPPPEELEAIDVTVGDGPAAALGDEITVHYVGVRCDTGAVIDESWGSEPATFALEEGALIEGWVQGIPGMKVGGRRLLIIPPHLGYGTEGNPAAGDPDDPASIPPGASLWFVVDLLAVG